MTPPEISCKNILRPSDEGTGELKHELYIGQDAARDIVQKNPRPSDEGAG